MISHNEIERAKFLYEYAIMGKKDLPRGISVYNRLLPDIDKFKNGPDEWAVGMYKETKTIYFVISGTDDKMEWKSNFDIVLSSGIHTGFYGTAKNIYKQIKEKIHLQDFEKYQFYFVGYSRGGPIAMLLNCFFGSECKTITFGCPRLGNEIGYDFCRRLLKKENVMHIIQRGDFVTRVPTKRKYVDNFGNKIIQGSRIQWLMPWRTKINHERYFV